MSSNKKFIWKDFLSFRKQIGMPLLNEKIIIGSGKATVNSTLTSLNVDNDAKIQHRWSFTHDIFYETIIFDGGLIIHINTPFSNEEKMFFLNQWFQDKKVSYWGVLNGDTQTMTSKTMGWALIDSINNFVYQNNPFNENEDKLSEKLWHSSGYGNDGMSLSYTFEKSNKTETPRLCFQILNGGIYYSYFEQVNHKDHLGFLEYLPIDVEKRFEQQLEKLSDMIKDFFEKHEVELDPMRGVIPLK